MRTILIAITFFIVSFVTAAAGMIYLADKRPLSADHPFYILQETAVLWSDSDEDTTMRDTASSPNQAQQQGNPNNIDPAAISFLQDVDHSIFPLRGGHDVACESCHVDGAFADTTTTCSQCHQPPAQHLEGECSTCHLFMNWKPYWFDHVGISDCVSCHTDIIPPNHYAGQCSTCHNTGSWSDATIDHNGLTDCQSCHAQPVGHYSGQCSTCHNTGNWNDATIDHNGLTDCQSCHAQPVGHYSGQCSACHNTGGWDGVTFNHSGLTDCQSCHAQPAAHHLGQ